MCKMRCVCMGAKGAIGCSRLGTTLRGAIAHLDCRLQFDTVCLAQVDGDSEDRHHLSLVVTIQSPGQLLQAALDSVPQSILHFLVNLSSRTVSRHITIAYAFHAPTFHCPDNTACVTHVNVCRCWEVCMPTEDIGCLVVVAWRRRWEKLVEEVF